MVKIDYTEDAEEAEAKVAKKSKAKAKAQDKEPVCLRQREHWRPAP